MHFVLGRHKRIKNILRKNSFEEIYFIFRYYVLRYGIALYCTSYIYDFFIGRPDPVEDCKMQNKTYNSLLVTCHRGYNGGMPQTFVIEVHEQRYYDDFVKKYRGASIDSGSMPASSSSDRNSYGYGQMFSGTTTTLGGITPLPPSPITRLEMAHEPIFALENMKSGTAFTLVIYAKNEKVRQRYSNK